MVVTASRTYMDLLLIYFEEYRWSNRDYYSTCILCVTVVLTVEALDKPTFRFFCCLREVGQTLSAPNFLSKGCY